jgi:hypothetical protein
MNIISGSEKFKVRSSRLRARADMNFSLVTGRPQAHEELF